MIDLFRAISLLTVLPCGRYAGAGDWGRATPYFSVVGALVGASLAALDLAMAGVLSLPVRAALILTAATAVTGGLHLDGLADTLDGLYGGPGREKALEIMRDSRVGAMGAAGLTLSLLLKYALLAGLEGPLRPLALFLTPLGGRLAMVPAISLYPYARSGPGLGRAFAGRAGRREILLALAVTVLVSAPAVALWAAGPAGAPLKPPFGPAFRATFRAGSAFGISGLAAALLAGALLAKYAAGRLGGLTGDVYGAVNEAAELAFLLFAVLAGPGVMP